jgi:hypothetical protein
VFFKLWGKPNLSEGFSWSPTQLLEMIKEVDKICPEEITLDPQTNNDAQAGDSQTTTTD